MEYLSKNTVIRIINHQKIIPLFEREYLQEHIKLEKAADVAEVKHGEWETELDELGWNKHTCNNCGYVKRTDIHVSLGWNYCPNCGAKMDGGKAK